MERVSILCTDHLVNSLEIASPRLLSSIFAFGVPPIFHHSFEATHLGQVSGLQLSQVGTTGSPFCGKDFELGDVLIKT